MLEINNMKVLVVGREDYSGVLHNIWGLRIAQKDISKADLIIDKDTGKILKSRYF